MAYWNGFVPGQSLPATVPLRNNLFPGQGVTLDGNRRRSEGAIALQRDAWTKSHLVMAKNAAIESEAKAKAAVAKARKADAETSLAEAEVKEKIRAAKAEADARIRVAEAEEANKIRVAEAEATTKIRVAAAEAREADLKILKLGKEIDVFTENGQANEQADVEKVVEKPKKQPNGRRDHPVGEVGEDILAIAAYYERKERLRPRRQSAEKGQGNEQADVEKVVEKPKKRARTGKPGTTLSIWSQKALGDDDGNSEGEVVVEPTAEDCHLSIHGAGSVPKRVTNKSEGLQIGQRIEVLFDDPPDYFPGTITGKDKGRWQIEYDDGDREELDLSTTKYRLLRGEGLIAGPKAHKAAKPAKRKGTRPTRRGLTLLDLMKKGLMEPGQGVLRVEYKGHVFLGDLTPEGSICYEGELWESPTSWSMHVKRRVSPGMKVDNGWESVFYVAKDGGEIITLKQLRSTHALKMVGSGSFEKETATAPKVKPALAA